MEIQKPNCELSTITLGVKLNENLYETDFYPWTQQQANLLRR